MAGRGAVVAAGVVASLTIALGAVAPVRAVDPDPKPTRIKVRVSAAEVIVLQPGTIQGRVRGPERRVELELRDAYEDRQDEDRRAGSLPVQDTDQLVRQEAVASGRSGNEDP